MDFASNQDFQIKEMLKQMGLSKIDELFALIPEKIRLKRPETDDGLSEFEGLKLMERLASKNSFPNYDNYLGGGAYEHHVPALVGAICSRSEFLTCYTPYQAEASQGTLQAIFEFQSAICALTGLDVANASLYDAASACAEALLMAIRLQNKNKVVVAETVNPFYKGVIKQYLDCHDIQIIEAQFNPSGKLDLNNLKIDGDTAAILVQSPNFLGVIEDVEKISEIAKKNSALTVLCANPLAFGLFPSAAESGVDIVIGDCQPLGLSLQFGGPYVGYMACKQEYVRQMPGRIVGETVDAEGKRGYVLTLQAREQHIRREKATSNICTNQALAALASLVTILWYGKEGIQKLALTNYQRASYLKACLAKSGCKVLEGSETFNEFAVKFPSSPEKVLSHFRKNGIEPGLYLGEFYSRLDGYFLVAVTETKSKSQLDKYCDLAKTLI